MRWKAGIILKQMKPLKRSALILLIVFLQVNITWFAMTTIVCARGEAHPSKPSQIAEEQPGVFWGFLLGAVVFNNFLVYLCLKMTESQRSSRIATQRGE